MDSACTVRVAPDGMSATLSVSSLADPIELQAAIDQAISDAGIVVGIDHAAVARAIERRGSGEGVTIARGCPPVDGEPARIEFSVDPNAGPISPTLLANGRADFHNLHTVHNVRAGQPVAQKIPATTGTDGYTVRGQRLAPRPGRDATLAWGKGCAISTDGLMVLAAVDGYVTLSSGRKITVLPVYEVRGDVDLSTGNIQFVGNVVVHGSVMSGLGVEAEGDVTIDGYVDAAQIRAGGNVTIRRGVQGRGKGHVEAGGTVTAAFVENCALHAGGDVTIAEAIMHSEVSSGGSITCTTGRGLIVGGRLRAAFEINAKIIGAPMGTLTDLEVGADPKLREELIEVISEQRTVDEGLRKAEQALVYLSELGRITRELAEEQKDRIKALAATRTHMAARKEELAQRRSELEDAAEGRLRGAVRASDRICAGTRVTIGRAMTLVQENLVRSSLALGEDRTIRIGAYD